VHPRFEAYDRLVPVYDRGTAIPLAWQIARTFAYSIAAAALSLGLSSCGRIFCDSDDSVRVVLDEPVTVTEVCMLGRCVTESTDVVIPAATTKIFSFSKLARSAKVKSTPITVKYQRNGVPLTWEQDVTPSIDIPNGEGCDPVEYNFRVRLT
jgi:hypothetical protein